MADRKAIVAGSVSYIEIGAAGGTTDYLDIGPAGITGTSGYATMNIRVNQDGVGDKTMVIGEQGSTAAGNVVHFFGSTDALTTGTVKIHGNLQVDGTENVAGNATFESNATFEGDTTFGDLATDRVIFVADVDSNIRFDANTGSNRTISIEAESVAANAGTDLQLQAGDAGTTYAGAGADVYLIPAGGAAVSGYGSVYFGNTGAVGTADGYQLLANNGTPATYTPGIRYNDNTNVWEIRTDTVDWTTIASGSVLPSGTNVYDHIYWNGATWVADPDLWLADQADAYVKVTAGDNQGRVVVGGQDASSANTAGGDALLGAGSGNGTGTGGDAYVVGGGNIGGTAVGDVILDGGSNDSVNSFGDIYVGSAYTSTVYFGNTRDVSIDMQGVSGGSQVVSDIVFDDTTSRSIYVEANATTGQALTVVGGDGTTAGGSAAIYGGDATTGTAGAGGVFGGAATTGTGGDVELVPGGGATAYGNTICGGSTDTSSYFLFRTTGASTPSKAAGPGFRYPDSSGYMEVWNPDGAGAWERIASGGSGQALPTGTLNQVLQHNGTLWVSANDFTLPSGATRTIDIASAATGDALNVRAGQGTGGAGGSLGLYGGTGSTNGGGTGVYGGTASGGTGGDVLLEAGAGTVANGGINLGDNVASLVTFGKTVAGTIDFEGAGSRVVSDIVFDDTTSRSIYVEANATTGQALTVVGGDGTTAGGSAAIYGGDATTGTAGAGGVFGGAATTGTGGDVELVPGGGATAYGNAICGGSTDTSSYFLFRTTGASTPSKAAGPGFRYPDSSGYMEVWNPDGAGAWERIASGGSGQALPTGTLDQVLQHNGTLWVAQNDIALPAGGTRSISVSAPTASGGGDDLYISSGAPNTTGSGGYMWIYVPNSLTDANGDGIDINAGNAAGTNRYGGSIWIKAGNSSGTGASAAGGNVRIEAGDNGDTVYGGHVGISPGSGPSFAERGHVIMGLARRYPLTEHHCPHFQFWIDPATYGHCTIDCLTQTVAANLTLAAGPSTGGANVGGNLYLNAGTGSTNGIVLLGGTDTSQVVFGNGGSAVTDNALFANSDTAADRAGIGYDDANDKWQVHLDGGGATWYDILTTGNSEPVPTGAADGEIMEWDQTGTQAWIVAQDLALPDGAARAIGMKPHTAATAAYALTVSGQANTSVGPGTTTGGNLTVKGGDSTAENGGDLLLAGGVGSGSNGDILFGDGTNPFNIDFHYSSGNRINSNMIFADKAAPGSWSIYPQTANTTVGTGLLLAGAQGGATATGGFQAGGISIRGGIGGASLGTGNGGDAGNVNIGGDAGGAGGTGGAGGDGTDVNINGGNGGAVGATGGQGGAISAVCGTSTGNISGPSMTLTAGAAVGTATAGNMLITAGANSSTGTGGYVQITGGASTGGTAGSLILDAGAGVTNGSIAIGGTNATTIQFGQGANTFDMTVGSSPPVFSASGTATIDLPGTAAATNNFRIQGVAVSNNVDAPNLGTLTAGPTSDASALHTHTGLGNSFTKEAGEALNNGALVSVARESTDSNNPKAWNCDTSSSPADDSNSPIPAGFTQAAYADGATATVIVAGEVDVPSGQWTGGIPAKTSIGSLVYASATDGQVTLTPPASGTGLYRTKVGILTDSDGATTTKILVQIGDPLLMA